MARRSRQDEILAFIQDYMQKNSYAPSVREIGEAVGLKSTATVHYHLSALQQQGLLTMERDKRRSISLPTGSAGHIPIVGVVTAGHPILAQERIEGYLPVDGSTRDRFALRVRGESMIGAGILDGDLVIVRQQSEALNGQIVVALIGDEATVKRLHFDRDGVWLLPENPAFEPIDGREARILGRVVGLVRDYR